MWATTIDVLPVSRIVERRGDHIAVRSPSNPTHWWGTLLLFDRPPRPGDRERWERAFAAAFAGAHPPPAHRTFAWDDATGDIGAAREEFTAHGHDLERESGLIAAPEDVRPHPRASRDVQTRALDPHGDEPLWEQVVEVQVAGRDLGRGETEAEHRAFSRARQADLRELFAAGRGAWYVALDGGAVVGSCGVVVTDGRGRFQAVDTVASHRRRGICSRLVVDAAHHAAAAHGARRLVIVADPDYHAQGIYESLGFRLVERTAGVCRPPGREANPEGG